LKAVIGRAREGKGVVEIELMSSTSSEVCELWNGYVVVRVLGSPPILELLYHTSAPERPPLDGIQDGLSMLDSEFDKSEMIPLRPRDGGKPDGFHHTGVYNFEKAIDARLLMGSHPQNRPLTYDDESRGSVEHN
jgi:hypothetical protein